MHPADLKTTLYRVAEQMVLAATTAPKGRGRDNLEAAILEREDLLRLADEAHRDRPRLQTHDAYGRRVDRVAFNPAWHEVMGTAIAHGVAGLSSSASIVCCSRMHPSSACSWGSAGQGGSGASRGRAASAISRCSDSAGAGIGRLSVMPQCRAASRHATKPSPDVPV